MTVDHEINVRFEYDAGRDLYVAYACGTMRTEADCQSCFAMYEAELGPLERRVDLIVVLDMFTIAEEIRETWTTYLADLHARFTRYTVRVFLTGHHVWLARFAPANTFARDIESAMVLIEERRRQGARGTR